MVDLRTVGRHISRRGRISSTSLGGLTIVTYQHAKVGFLLLPLRQDATKIKLKLMSSRKLHCSAKYCWHFFLLLNTTFWKQGYTRFSKISKIFNKSPKTIHPDFIFPQETLSGIWYHLYNLKNVKKTHRGVLILVKLQTKAFNFTKSNTSLCVNFTFCKL